MTNKDITPWAFPESDMPMGSDFSDTIVPLVEVKKEYCFTEGHVIMLCMLAPEADSPVAPGVRKEIVEIVKAWRRGTFCGVTPRPT